MSCSQVLIMAVAQVHIRAAKNNVGIRRTTVSDDVFDDALFVKNIRITEVRSYQNEIHAIRKKTRIAIRVGQYYRQSTAVPE